jgi:hypothetical protein
VTDEERIRVILAEPDHGFTVSQLTIFRELWLFGSWQICTLSMLINVGTLNMNIALLACQRTRLFDLVPNCMMITVVDQVAALGQWAISEANACMYRIPTSSGPCRMSSWRNAKEA